MVKSESTQIRNSASRDEIFSSIRASLAKSSPYDKAHRDHHHGGAASYSVHAAIDRSLGELIDIFRHNLSSVGAQCITVENEVEASEQIREIVHRRGAKKVAISDSALVNRLLASVSNVEVIDNVSRDELFNCDLGITAAQWAIAETGTLVLESNAERHRLVSLIPPIHICLLKAGTIRQKMDEVLELTARDLSRVVTFITGASRTSDIELTLAIGVHGPGELIVIVVND